MGIVVPNVRRENRSTQGSQWDSGAKFGGKKGNLGPKREHLEPKKWEFGTKKGEFGPKKGDCGCPDGKFGPKKGSLAQNWVFEHQKGEV